MTPPSPRILLLVLLATCLGVGAVAGQDVDRVRPSLLREVMPEADRFDDSEGSPPVRRAYRGEELLGYVFMTSDLPPEERGYSGPVRAVVGMTPDGTLTGVRVTEYHESLMSSKGDFLRNTPGFQQQYAGKWIGDSFRVYEDIDGISKVSISVRALSRGVRDAARRVAAAYPPARPQPTAPVGDVLSMSWFVMRQAGVTTRMDVTEEGEDPVGISLVHLESEELSRYLVGGLHQYIVNAVERRGRGGDLVLYAVDGPGSRMALQSGWAVEQDGVRLEVPPEDVIMLGSPWEGLLSGETTAVGVIILDESIDIGAPLTFLFRRGAELTASAEYTSQRALAVMAESRAGPREGATAEATMEVSAPAGPAASDDAPAEAPTSAAAGPASVSPLAADASPVADAAPAAAPMEVERLVQLDFGEEPEETALGALIASASPMRVGLMLLVLVLATLAFFTKNTGLRWVSLGTTVAVLGFIEGGFLSITHILGLIWVGPSAVMSDLPLLMMVTFTVVTVVFWGRVFCGFLCPFGALQDFLDHLVPARFKRDLPPGAHRVALKAKYVVLAAVLLPALLGSELSFYQYVEPFGTVFFLSTNVVLWTIAGSILAVSAVVPRFYCRYACPLGASLAVASLVTLRRIPRVEQCDHCKVCERKCPTGAIDGPAIDFKECVRCNVCEVQLIERAGVCKHDMETIRPRLVQIRARETAGVAGSVG